jgi:hypothetical protein
MEARTEIKVLLMRDLKIAKDRVQKPQLEQTPMKAENSGLRLALNTTGT